MTKATESKWRSLIAEQERSGESVREFAAMRGINATTLYWWRSRLGRRRLHGRRGKAPIGLVPVTVIDGGDALAGGEVFELQLGAMTLRIPRGFVESDLRRLVQALRC